jgi:FAD/FMN-containing dehydrogenase
MSARHRIPELSPEGRAAAAALRRAAAGTVSTSPLTRWLYSTDASIYRVVPDVVLVASSVADLHAAAAIAAEYDVPLVARGAATSVAGQAVGPGIAVDCFKLDRILAIDPDGRSARVEPGVIQASLNRAAAAFGLEFGPDTSTVDQATIGGMVGNNSSGSRSIVYGETKDKVLRVHAVLVGGEPLVFGQCRGADLASGLAGPGAAGPAAALAEVRERYRRPLAEDYPRTRRCTSGYNLRELLEPEPNLGKLLAGSEGTLALFTELEVALDPLPAARVGAALTFATLRAALEANVAILETGPSAVELLDLDPLRAAPNLAAFARMAPLLAGDARAMLTVEYQGTEDEARDGLDRLRALAGDLGATRLEWLEDPAALAEAGALRRAVLPLLMGAPGAERPASFVEDTAVAPERLAGFVDEFERLVAAEGARASFTGHASAGCMHIRPLLDLKSAAGVRRMETLAAAVGRLVAEYHGAISGEHGVGRSRSWSLPGLLGPDLYAAMVAVKDAFDPRRLLGPGAIVDGRAVAESLRYGADYRGDGAWAPRLSYAAEGGFDLAVEKCFGAGLCKKLTGTMCPPAAASRSEAYTTRARANALQGVLCGAVPLAAISAEEFREVLGTCVACKACKTECPAGVDMAALKVEWLAELRARAGVPALARGIGEFRRLAALASPVAPLVNALARTRAARLVTDRAGVAHQRPLPAFSRRALTRRLAGAPARAGAALFVDCFVQYQEPQVGEALASLLRAAGVELALVDAG